MFLRTPQWKKTARILGILSMPPIMHPQTAMLPRSLLPIKQGLLLVSAHESIAEFLS